MPHENYILIMVKPGLLFACRDTNDWELIISYWHVDDNIYIYIFIYMCVCVCMCVWVCVCVFITEDLPYLVVYHAL